MLIIRANKWAPFLFILAGLGLFMCCITHVMTPATDQPPFINDNVFWPDMAAKIFGGHPVVDRNYLGCGGT